MSMTDSLAGEPAESLEVRAVAVERLTFFADAVIAIAITLLALDLPLPEGTTNAELLHSVNANREDYIAFLISFLVIGARWGVHHRVFRYVVALSRRMSRLTLYWVLMQVITPFATRVLAGDGAFQFRFILYASVQVLAGLIFLLMLRDLRGGDDVMRSDTPPAVLSRAYAQTAALTGAFLLSIPVSFVNEPAAYALWIIVPIASGLARRLADRRRGWARPS